MISHEVPSLLSYVWTNKTKDQNQHVALGGKFYNAQFDWLFQNSGLRIPPTKIGQVDPEPRLSIARRVALWLPRMMEAAILLFFHPIKFLVTNLTHNAIIEYK